MFVFPICRDNPVRNVPWVVYSLIVLNTVILIVTYVAFSPDALFGQYGFVPAQPHITTLFSSMFLHTGLWHLLGNMWFLWMFGNRVENMFGPWLFLTARTPHWPPAASGEKYSHRNFRCGSSSSR